jgi:hypothetical protein
MPHVRELKMSDLSWLDELDVDAIPDDEYTLPRNTYLCRTVDFKEPAVQSKDESLSYFIINWQINEGEYETYNKFGQWIALPPLKNVNESVYVAEFDPRNIRDHQVVIIRLKKVVRALGYGDDDFKGILRQVMESDFSWIENRLALINCHSYKDAQGYAKVKVNEVTAYEGDAQVGSDDVDPMSSTKKKTDVPF